MNVLLACPGIFSQIGGGQRFYANLILNNPTIDFYCFGEATASAGFPKNAHFVQPTDVHTRQKLRTVSTLRKRTLVIGEAP